MFEPRIWLVAVALAVLGSYAQVNNCDSLKVYEFSNTTNASGCRLWMDSVPNYGFDGIYVLTTTADGSVLTIHWRCTSYIMAVSLNNDVCVWSGSTTEPGDVSNTTLAIARYTRIMFLVSYDHKVFYANDNGKLKKIDTTADLVTHIAGSGETAEVPADLLQSLGPAFGAKIGDAYQAFVTKADHVYLAVPVEHDAQFVVLRYNPTLSTVSLALPFALEQPSTPFGAILNIMPPPVSSAIEGDLLLLSRVDNDGHGAYRILRYHARLNGFSAESDGAFEPSVPDRFGNFGGLGLPDDRSKINYITNTHLSPRDTHHVLHGYDLENHKGSLATGIGSTTGVVPSKPMWADMARIGIVFGMAYSPDGRHLWIAHRGGDRYYLVRVEFKDASLVPLPPISQWPFSNYESTLQCQAGYPTENPAATATTSTELNGTTARPPTQSSTTGAAPAPVPTNNATTADPVTPSHSAAGNTTAAATTEQTPIQAPPSPSNATTLNMTEHTTTANPPTARPPTSGAATTSVPTGVATTAVPTTSAQTPIVENSTTPITEDKRTAAPTPVTPGNATAAAPRKETLDPATSCVTPTTPTSTTTAATPDQSPIVATRDTAAPTPKPTEGRWTPSPSPVTRTMANVASNPATPTPTTPDPALTDAPCPPNQTNVDSEERANQPGNPEPNGSSSSADEDEICINKHTLIVASIIAAVAVSLILLCVAVYCCGKRASRRKNVYAVDGIAMKV